MQTNRKKRVLWITEASYTCSGFGTYAYEVLKRLQATNKYELAEFASYGFVNDPRDSNVKWPFYANAVRDDDPRASFYKSNPIHQFGAWRFDRVCLDFKPDIVCTPPGELVLTKDGYKPIENIKLGDLIATHTGKLQKVTKLYKREYDGDLYYLYWNGCATPLKLTPNHPVLIYKKQNQTNQKKSIQKIYQDQQPVFIPIKDIKQKDLVVLTPPKINSTELTIDVTDHLDNYTEENNKIYPVRNNSRYHGINKYIKCNSDFGKFLGYLISDGCIQKGSINFFFGLNETRFIQDVLYLMKNIFHLEGTYKKSSYSNMYRMTFSSSILCKFLKTYCNQYKIPKNILLYNKECLEGIIYGLIRGDGCYKTNTVSFCSSKKPIAYLYRIVCGMLHIPTNLQYKEHNGYNFTIKNKNHKNFKVFEIEGYGTSANKLHDICQKHNTFDNPIAKKPCRVTQIINGHLVSSVKRLRKSNYKGIVYNIEVENDHSYILNQVSIKNCAFRDPWMMDWETLSPARKFYHQAWMPTCDSSPFKEEWVDTSMQADAVFTYSDYSLEVLRKQSNNKMKLKCSASPGTDMDIFKPAQNKATHRTLMGLPPDINIIGTVMRNQKRKLYPDLLDGFRIFLEKCKKSGLNELAQKTYLYIHTSYPDAGWNFSWLLKESDVSHKIIFSYVCRNCKKWFAAPFQDAITLCPYCKTNSAVLPSVANGVSSKHMADIYKCFDVYVQYSVCEGFGMPIVEAASCGVPIMAVNYSAMADIIKKSGNIPLKVAKMFLDLEIQAYRAMPDNEYFANELIKFFQLSSVQKQKLGNQARIACQKYFNYDNTARIWETHFDSVDLNTIEKKWNTTPPNIYEVPSKIPDNLSNDQFVDWLFYEVLRQPELRYTYQGLKLATELNLGVSITQGIQPQTRDSIFQSCKQRAMNNIIFEKARCNMITLPNEDYIDYAKMKKDMLNS
jgi:glycosyltransferase involved in cell wall biosynthesis